MRSSPCPSPAAPSSSPQISSCHAGSSDKPANHLHAGRLLHFGPGRRQDCSSQATLLQTLLFQKLSSFRTLLLSRTHSPCLGNAGGGLAGRAHQSLV